jgi:uncharacterized RDD family membrane protein YckC
MEAAVQQVCASCGNPALPDGKLCLFCGDVLTVSLEKPPLMADLSNPAATPDATTPEYAGFWLRVWAGVIDVFIEAIGALLFSGLVYYSILLFADSSYGLTHATAAYVSGIAAIAFLIIEAWLYCAFTESSSHRATVGKRIVGLQVVTASGDKLSFGQATVRHFMKFLSLFTAAVGFMMAGWTKRRQALHDMPSDCVVICVPPERFSILRR